MDSISELTKFGAGAERGPAHVYAGVVERDEHCGPGGRLVMGPARGHLALVEALVACLPEPLRLMYVLVVPRGKSVKPGRYEAPTELTGAEVNVLLSEFSAFLERDGRHHLWVASPGNGTVVYDRHNLVYAYGPLDCFEHQASRCGLHAGRPEVPSPHWHAYHAEFDAEQDRLLRRFAWIRHELQESDES